MKFIGICADYLHRSHLKPLFPKNISVELMGMAIRSVSFSFNNRMY